MKLFEANFAVVVLRYYLMMAVILIAGFTGQWWLAGVGFLVFLSAMMSVSFNPGAKEVLDTSKIITLAQQTKQMKEAV